MKGKHKICGNCIRFTQLDEIITGDGICNFKVSMLYQEHNKEYTYYAKKAKRCKVWKRNRSVGPYILSDKL